MILYYLRLNGPKGSPTVPQHQRAPMGFPDGSDGKESTCNAGDLGLIPGLGRSVGGGKGYPLQYPWTEELGGLESMVLQRVGHD